MTSFVRLYFRKVEFPMIKFDHVDKVYANGTKALDNVNLEIEQGEFVAIIGLSGAGKSTLIRTINKMIDVTSGTVTVYGTDVSSLKGKELRRFRRKIGMVFQSFNLVMRTTVLNNVLVARVADMSFFRTLFGLYSKEDKVAALEALDKVGILDKAYSRADQLSGGQQQRVALARALVIEPSVLLFDEPLSNLDAKLRVSMRTEIRRIQQEVGITAIYVTHDQEEALTLSDRIAVFNKGYIEQIGTPNEVYNFSKTEFVANFIGDINRLEDGLVRDMHLAADQHHFIRLERVRVNREKGEMKSKDGAYVTLNVEGNALKVPASPDMEVGKQYTVVLRPEAAMLADEGGLPCRVVLSCFMGSYQNYHVMVGNTLVKLEEHNPKNKRIYEVGEQCSLVFDPDSVHVL